MQYGAMSFFVCEKKRKKNCDKGRNDS